MKQYKLKPGTDSRIYYLLTIKDDGEMELVFHGTDRTLTEEASVNQDGWIVTNGAMYPPIDHPNGRWQEVECSEIVPQEEVSPLTDDATREGQVIDLSLATSGTQEPSADDTLSHSCSSPCVSQPEPTDEPVIPSEQNHAPVEQDLFAQMQMEMQALRKQNEELRMKNEEFCNMIQTERTAVCSPTLPETGNATRRGQEPCADDTLSHRCSSPRVSRERRRQPSSAKRQASQDPYSRLYGSPAIAVDHTDDHSDRNRKIISAVATAAVFIVLVNTIGLFGIAALGLLAGGLIK